MRNRKIRQIIFVPALLAVFMFSVSCSRTKPEITYGFIELVLYQGETEPRFIELVLYQGETEPREQYSFFILPQDDDGMENLDELYLYNDREQLRWLLKSDEWVTYTEDDKTWIGTRSIAVQEGKLPRGVFRAELVNKGGERGERNFTFDAAARFDFPELEIEGGMYTINSDWPVNRLVCYDRSGNYSSTITLPSLSGSVSSLNLPSSVYTAALWAEDEAYFTSAFTNVVPVR